MRPPTHPSCGACLRFQREESASLSSLTRPSELNNGTAVAALPTTSNGRERKTCFCKLAYAGIQSLTQLLLKIARIPSTGATGIFFCPFFSTRPRALCIVLHPNPKTRTSKGNKKRIRYLYKGLVFGIMYRMHNGRA